MTIEYVSLHANMTVKESLESIRKKAIDKETIYTCYVTDSTNKLIGVPSYTIFPLFKTTHKSQYSKT